MNSHGEIVVRLSKDKIKIISMTVKTKAGTAERFFIGGANI